MSKKILFSICIVLVVLFFTCSTVQAQVQPVAIAWKIDCEKYGYAVIFDEGIGGVDEICKFKLTYICLENAGTENETTREYDINLPSVEKYMIYVPLHNPWTHVIERVGVDILGMPIDGFFLTTTAYPEISFAVYGHTLVGGVDMDVDFYESRYSSSETVHAWTYSKKFKWISPGFESYVPNNW